MSKRANLTEQINRQTDTQQHTHLNSKTENEIVTIQVNTQPMKCERVCARAVRTHQQWVK